MDTNTNDWFTLVSLNLFLSPQDFLLPAKKKIFRDILGKFSYFIIKMYVECTPLNCLIEAILSSTWTLNIPLFHRKLKKKKKITRLSPFDFWPGAMINPQWLKLRMSGKYFHGPIDVRVIEVRLYIIYQLYIRHFFQWKRTNISLISPRKNMLWVPIKIPHNALLISRHSICFRWEIRKILWPLWKHTYIILTLLKPTFI